MGYPCLFLFLLNEPTATAASSLSSSSAPALSQGLFPVQSTKTPSIANTISSLITATAAQVTTENAPAPEGASTDWWDISTDGTLTIHSGHTLSYTDTTDPQWQSWPWTKQASTIKKAVIEPGVSAEQTLGFLFAGCTNLTDVEGLSNIKVNTVTTPGHPAVNTLAMMFQNCKSLTAINLDGLDTSSVQSMDSMFFGCSALTSLDLSTIDTSNVTTMSAMFASCSALKQLTLGKKFVTSHVTTMYEMFLACRSLVQLDLSNFDTSSVTNMREMFSTCSSLTQLDLSNFDTSNVTTMLFMFMACTSLTPDNSSPV